MNCIHKNKIKNFCIFLVYFLLWNKQRNLFNSVYFGFRISTCNRHLTRVPFCLKWTKLAQPKESLFRYWFNHYNVNRKQCYFEAKIVTIFNSWCYYSLTSNISLSSMSSISVANTLYRVFMKFVKCYMTLFPLFLDSVFLC